MRIFTGKISSLVQHVHIGDSKVPITSFSNAQTMQSLEEGIFRTIFLLLTLTMFFMVYIADASVVENEAIFCQV